MCQVMVDKRYNANVSELNKYAEKSLCYLSYHPVTAMPSLSDVFVMHM